MNITVQYFKRTLSSQSFKNNSTSRMGSCVLHRSCTSVSILVYGKNTALMQEWCNLADLSTLSMISELNHINNLKCEGVGWIHLAEDRPSSRLIIVLTFRTRKLARSATDSFLRSTLLCEVNELSKFWITFIQNSNNSKIMVTFTEILTTV